MDSHVLLCSTLLEALRTFDNDNSGNHCAVANDEILSAERPTNYELAQQQSSDYSWYRVCDCVRFPSHRVLVSWGEPHPHSFPQLLDSTNRSGNRSPKGMQICSSVASAMLRMASSTTSCGCASDDDTCLSTLCVAFAESLILRHQGSLSW